MTFEEFLETVSKTDLMPAFSGGDRPELSVDVPCRPGGVSLEKGARNNIAGHPHKSVVALANTPDLSLADSSLEGIGSFETLVNAFSWKVEDASPDSVTGVFFLALRLAGVEMPERQKSQWILAIEDWEATGIVDDPAVSWPALAAALAHTFFDDAATTSADRVCDYRDAWQAVLWLLVETMQNQWPPSAIPKDAEGTHLGRARAALEEERARYERALSTQQIFQLSIPMMQGRRRRLVDMLLTEENEFTGAFKVFARNDEKGAPLGRGFSVIVLVRPSLKETEPKNWLTVSVDVRQSIELSALWKELERQERAAWEHAGWDRPCPETGGRKLFLIPEDEQPYEQPWFIDPTGGLVASPDAVHVEISPEGETRKVGSLLTEQQVLNSLFDLYDPLSGVRVRDINGGGRKRIAKVAAKMCGDSKRVLAASWPKDDPLPHPGSPIAMGGLSPFVVRCLGARTMGFAADEVIEKAFDLEDVDLITFGSGIAAITEGGAYLIDPGRRRGAQLEEAVALVENLAMLAKQLDEIQQSIVDRAQLQVAEANRLASLSDWLGHLRFCVQVNSSLIEIRTNLDTPLKTDEAGLQPLKTALSKKWNIRLRLNELTAELEALQLNARATEELRSFRSVRLIGAIATALILADALSGRFAKLLVGWQNPLETNSAGVAPKVELALFFGIWIVALVLLGIGAKFLRQRI